MQSKNLIYVNRAEIVQLKQFSFEIYSLIKSLKLIFKIFKIVQVPEKVKPAAQPF